MSDAVRWPYKGHKIKAKTGMVYKDGSLAIKQSQFGVGSSNSGPAGKAKRFRQPNRRPYFT